MPNKRRFGSDMAATPETSLEPMTEKPAGTCETVSKWLIQMRDRSMPFHRGSGDVTVS